MDVNLHRDPFVSPVHALALVILDKSRSTLTDTTAMFAP